MPDDGCIVECDECLVGAFAALNPRKLANTGTNLLRHASAYPAFPVFLLTNLVGKTAPRPRNRERKSFTFVAGVSGIDARAGCARCTRISGSAPMAAHSERSAVRRFSIS